MNNILKALSCLAVSCSLFSCTLDNYTIPSSTLHGSFIDKETGELIEQDIIRGTQIEYQEGRFTTNQYIIVKADGSYYNSQLFSGTYRITPVRGNFEPVETATVDINGDTKLDFKVLPFLRIKNVSIFKNGTKIRALFKVQQTGFDNVLKLGLYAGGDAAVGANVNLDYVEIPVGSTVNEDQYYTIELNTENNSKLIKGRSYFFRVGGVIDAPEAKFNYARSIELTL
ncbi:DUF3823 domain-containing protein [Gynurincola endophyticus]|uniref:DUF3823 domain-containing protein n=1 Tax=Gynurincola endophyticus TaxID=2479004 RepID=UPI000F8EBCC4|nr:DUF3823 domain-containing protein [Gynurincola endophyticus]